MRFHIMLPEAEGTDQLPPSTATNAIGKQSLLQWLSIRSSKS